MRKKIGLFILSLLLTITTVKAQFGSSGTNIIVTTETFPREQKDGYTESGLLTYIDYTKCPDSVTCYSTVESMPDDGYYWMDVASSSAKLSFQNYLGYHWFYGNQPADAYVKVTCYDQNYEQVYDSVVYVPALQGSNNYGYAEVDIPNSYIVYVQIYAENPDN